MNLRTELPALSTAVKVAVVASDALRRRELEHIVAASGQALVQMAQDADVVLTLESRSSETHAGLLKLRTRQVRQAAVLPGDATASQVGAAIRAVAVGLIVRAGTRREPGFERARARQAHPLLTPRELEILTAIGDGLSNKAIARMLSISQHTVKFHIESLFKKLDVCTRAEAVAKGLERSTDERVDV